MKRIMILHTPLLLSIDLPPTFVKLCAMKYTLPKHSIIILLIFYFRLFLLAQKDHIPLAVEELQHVHYLKADLS